MPMGPQVLRMTNKLHLQLNNSVVVPCTVLNSVYNTCKITLVKEL